MSAVDVAVVWQLRLPRVVLGALVGAMLAGGGASYQGVLRNPLADPYLLGVAAGAGLGATDDIVTGAATPSLLAAGRVRGPVCAVAITYSGRYGGCRPPAIGVRVILLAGVAIAALLTAVQTYLQQQHTHGPAADLRLDPR